MYRIIKGKYSGLIGRIETTAKADTAMFYPTEVKHPYRVVVFKTDLEEIPDIEPKTKRKD